MSDRPIEGPKQTKNLGQMGEWETIPCDGHFGVRNQEEDHKCGHSRGGKMGGGRGVSSGTQRELSAELAGGALKSMGMSRCSKEAARRGSDRTGRRCRKGSGHRKNGLTGPGTRSERADGNKAH